MKTPIWLDENGMEIKGPALPASLMEAEHLDVALRFMADRDGKTFRVRWVGDDALNVEFFREDVAVPAVTSWLHRQGPLIKDTTKMYFRSLIDTRVACETIVRDLLDPSVRNPRPPCLQRKDDILAYNIFDVCDATTFEEMTEASWGQGMVRAGGRKLEAVSRTFFLAETEDVYSWRQGETHTPIYGHEHPYTTLAWAAIQRNDDGEVTWVGRLVMVPGWTMDAALDVLYNHLEIKRVIHADLGWIGSSFAPTGTSRRVNLLDHLEVTKAFGGIDLETPGTGSAILEAGVRHHGWNQIPGWKRLWEGPPSGLSVLGQGFGFR